VKPEHYEIEGINVRFARLAWRSGMPNQAQMNFAISTRSCNIGFDRFAIQVETPDELQEV
jgi:hypothetical protein